MLDYTAKSRSSRSLALEYLTARPLKLTLSHQARQAGVES